ncbi:unnamed protein product [Boreogadus saida]
MWEACLVSLPLVTAGENTTLVWRNHYQLNLQAPQARGSGLMFQRAAQLSSVRGFALFVVGGLMKRRSGGYINLGLSGGGRGGGLIGNQHLLVGHGEMACEQECRNGSDLGMGGKRGFEFARL